MIEKQQSYIEDANLYKVKSDRKMLTEYKNPTKRQKSSLNTSIISKYLPKK